ncbi:integrase arm-type DNA-binding domain-containing protein [Porticoccus sp. W117]|uniref:tyrosine-type recombinase/integrase n=1 Tax=Porticoccus sp. W117 TaxID=3054777 RepID=UPI002597FD59|nr:integrase arm-type DNA-binding domain-containing protein [Porticoccus sp. W117]MDM3871820.1 integrase arm-type DNA-binding domain-containing protein [Porticoccus sp. W117]
MALTDTKIRSLKPRDKKVKVSDGRGLQLHVMPNGGKYWKYAYRFAGKQKELALGVYPDVSLKDARNRRDEARKQVAKGVNPQDVRRAMRHAGIEANANSFKVVALEWFDKKMSDKSKSHRDRTLRALQKDIFPYIGHRPISQVSSSELLRVLRKIENRGAIETAKRARQTCGQIFRYAIITDRAENDPAAPLVDALLPAQKRHLAAITEPDEVGKLLLAIDGFQGTSTVKAALRLSPLLFCRPGELRHMEWVEINFNDAIWEIPAEKMKMKEPHIVPLSNQSLEIIEEQKLLNCRGRYVFPSARGASRPLSENGVRTALRTMGYDNNTMTPHGFRAMARTLLDEVLEERVDWIEHQLSHAVKDSLGRAYNRTTHLKQRKKMMQKWANYLDSLKVAAANSKIGK